MKTFESIVNELERLCVSGFVKTHKTGNAGIGKTLKDELGITEENIQGPDGKSIELKVARKNATKMTKLFTKSPLPKNIFSKLRIEYGYPDENYPDKLVLQTTVNSNKFSTINGKKGFMVVGKINKIEIIMSKPSKNLLIPNPYWLKEDFSNSIKKKI